MIGDPAAVVELDVGDELSAPDRIVTAERLLAYGDGLLTSAAGESARVGRNIHTDAEYAREQGFEAPVVDGMLSTNYLSSMLVEHFGRAYVERGELRTKFIKPVLVDTLIRARGVVTRRTERPDGARYEAEVWVEDADGDKLVVGDAAIEVND